MIPNEFIGCFLGAATGTIFAIAAMKIIDIIRSEIEGDKQMTEAFDQQFDDYCLEAAGHDIRIITAEESPDLMPCIKDLEAQKQHLNNIMRKEA